MNLYWRQQLRNKYGNILRGYYGNGCAIDCGDGWYALLDRLLGQIQPLMQDSVVTDIKEKYGALCVYISSGTDLVFDLIDEAERDSRFICEVCGEDGELREHHHWLATLCTKHYLDWIER